MAIEMVCRAEICSVKDISGSGLLKDRPGNIGNDDRSMSISSFNQPATSWSRPAVLRGEGTGVDAVLEGICVGGRTAAFFRTRSGHGRDGERSEEGIGKHQKEGRSPAGMEYKPGGRARLRGQLPFKRVIALDENCRATYRPFPCVEDGDKGIGEEEVIMDELAVGATRTFGDAPAEGSSPGRGRPRSGRRCTAGAPGRWERNPGSGPVSMIGGTSSRVRT